MGSPGGTDPGMIGPTASRPSRRRRSRRLLALGGLMVLLAGTGCGSARHYDPAPGPSVPLDTAADLSAPLPLGLVVTGASTRGQGADDLAAAAGARVAQYRLGFRHPVDLIVADDHGTPAGSTAAVKTLLDKHVAGIVYASEGDHLVPGLASAAAASTPVLLPYASQPPSTATAWLTGPSREQVLNGYRSALADSNIKHPLVIATDASPGLAPLAGSDGVHALPDDERLADQAAALAGKATTGSNPVDGVLVDGSAAAEAEIVAGVQRSGHALPVVLGPAALTPGFADRLQQLTASGSGTLAGSFLTVGVASTDTSSSTPTASFLAAVRLAAQDRGEAAIDSTKSFSADGGATADTRSHDAVVALAAAAARAHSVEPAQVLGALRTMTVQPADGLAGPALTFNRPAALQDSDVVVLQATSQGTNQRAGVSQPATPLSWFALP